MSPPPASHPVLPVLVPLWMCMLMMWNVASADDSMMLQQQQLKTPATCAQILGDNVENDEKLLLCQLYESSSLLTNLEP
uniref:Secreted protein n=1 Tax=Ditylenchus dipsaci TaxID=166011 RepID=A0A915D438_9BILA